MEGFGEFYLWDNQKQDYDKLCKLDESGEYFVIKLTSPRGSGKTLSVLYFINSLIQSSKKTQNVLIIVPDHLMFQWRDAIDRSICKISSNPVLFSHTNKRFHTRYWPDETSSRLYLISSKEYDAFIFKLYSEKIVRFDFVIMDEFTSLILSRFTKSCFPVQADKFLFIDGSPRYSELENVKVTNIYHALINMPAIYCSTKIDLALHNLIPEIRTIQARKKLLPDELDEHVSMITKLDKNILNLFQKKNLTFRTYKERLLYEYLEPVVANLYSNITRGNVHLLTDIKDLLRMFPLQKKKRHTSKTYREIEEMKTKIRKIHDRITNMSSDDCCSICLEPGCDRNVSCCANMFHAKCLEQWFLIIGSNICPMCRQHNISTVAVDNDYQFPNMYDLTLNIIKENPGRKILIFAGEWNGKILSGFLANKKVYSLTLSSDVENVVTKYKTSDDMILIIAKTSPEGLNLENTDILVLLSMPVDDNVRKIIYSNALRPVRRSKLIIYHIEN